MTSPYIQQAGEKIGILPPTEYRREHYIFPREQSLASRLCEWEGRADALEPVWLSWLNAGCWLLFAYSMFKLAPVASAFVRAL